MNSTANLVPLVELGEIVSGATPNTNFKAYWHGDIPWITPANLTGHTGVYFKGQLKKITQAGYNSCSTKILPPGSILFSSRAPIGHCAVTAFPLCTNQGFKSIIPNTKLDSVYGFFALKFFTPELIALGRGATFLEINKEIVEDFRIPLPALPEQHRIADILTKADRLRRLRRYTLELSGAYLQTKFLEIFGDPVTNPMGWYVEELENVCKEIYRYPTFYGFQYIPAGIPVIRIGNILPDGYLNPDLKDYVFIEPQISKKFPRTILDLQDIVMAVRGDGSTVSRIGMLNSKGLVGANMSPNLLLFRTKQDVISPWYLFQLMTSSAGQRLLESFISRTAKKTITAEDIKQIKIPVPTYAIQEKFDHIAQHFERLQKQQQEALRQAEYLFQTLLHKAFQGEFTSDEINIEEPAIKTARHDALRDPELIDADMWQLALPLE